MDAREQRASTERTERRFPLLSHAHRHSVLCCFALVSTTWGFPFSLFYTVLKPTQLCLSWQHTAIASVGPVVTSARPDYLAVPQSNAMFYVSHLQLSNTTSITAIMGAKRDILYHAIQALHILLDVLSITDVRYGEDMGL